VSGVGTSTFLLNNTTSRPVDINFNDANLSINLAGASGSRIIASGNVTITDAATVLGNNTTNTIQSVNFACTSATLQDIQIQASGTATAIQTTVNNVDSTGVELNATDATNVNANNDTVPATGLSAINNNVRFAAAVVARKSLMRGIF
jgi:hypothetical protein